MSGEHGHGGHGHGLTPFQHALLESLERVGSALGVGQEALAILHRIESQQQLDSEKIGRILMITQEMQAAADQLSQLVHDVAAGVQTLIDQGGTTDGATSDEVIALLSPIASALQTVLDTLNQATGGGTPPPAPLAARRTGTARGPVRRS